MLEGLGISNSPMTTKQWALLRTCLLDHSEQAGAKPNTTRRRRILFSENFVKKELEKLHEFRAIFRDIMSLIDHRKELINYIFTSPAGDGDELNPQSPNKDA